MFQKIACLLSNLRRFPGPEKTYVNACTGIKMITHTRHPPEAFHSTSSASSDSTEDDDESLSQSPTSAFVFSVSAFATIADSCSRDFCDFSSSRTRTSISTLASMVA